MDTTLINQGMQCPYCLQPTLYHSGSGVGRVALSRWFLTDPHRTCLDCMAWVKCLPDSELGKGRLANERLRALKTSAFLLWKARKDELNSDSKNYPRGANMASDELLAATELSLRDINLWSDAQCQSAISFFEISKKQAA